MLDNSHSDQGLASLPSFTLAEFIAEAGRAIRQTLPKELWVEAVILEAKPGNHGLSLELVEPFSLPNGSGAFLRCFLGRKAMNAIEEETGAALDCTVLKGAHAKLRLKPNFHPRFHLEGEITGLDPVLIESLVSKRIELIRQTLRAEGLLEAQSRLATPGEITTVAVIHPDKSAGWSDVSAELARLEGLDILHYRSYPAKFEGEFAGAAVSDALTRILADEANGRPDVILIVRGGGAAAGLASLAHLGLARAICRCPVPVVTGLGHASDKTLLDEIAWRAADTPSKALGMIKAILRQRMEAALTDYCDIVFGMDRLVAQTLRPLLNAWGGALAEAVQKITAKETIVLMDLGHEIHRHILRCRGDIAVRQEALNRTAADLLFRAPEVPRGASAAARTVYSSVLNAARARLAAGDQVITSMQTSQSLSTAFLKRQQCELDAVLSTLAARAHRLLAANGAQLAQASNAIQSLGLADTMRRGFVLPLDSNRRILRTADAARGAARFELLFTDGSVACRPVLSA